MKVIIAEKELKSLVEIYLLHENLGKLKLKCTLEHPPSSINEWIIKYDLLNLKVDTHHQTLLKRKTPLKQLVVKVRFLKRFC